MVEICTHPPPQRSQVHQICLWTKTQQDGQKTHKNQCEGKSHHLPRQHQYKTISLDTVKWVANSVISCPGAQFSIFDKKDLPPNPSPPPQIRLHQTIWHPRIIYPGVYSTWLLPLHMHILRDLQRRLWITPGRYAHQQATWNLSHRSGVLTGLHHPWTLAPKMAPHPIRPHHWWFCYII